MSELVVFTYKHEDKAAEVLQDIEGFAITRMPDGLDFKSAGGQDCDHRRRLTAGKTS